MPYTINENALPKASAVAEEALEIGLTNTYSQGKLSVYSYQNSKAKLSDPFKGTPPYALDSSQAVSWAFLGAGVQLGGGPSKTSCMSLYYDSKLERVSEPGQKSADIFDTLVKGDLLFFGTKLTHVGLYVGEGQVLTIGGTGDWYPSYPWDVYDMTQGYWWNYFSGAVRRWK